MMKQKSMARAYNFEYSRNFQRTFRNGKRLAIEERINDKCQVMKDL